MSLEPRGGKLVLWGFSEHPKPSGYEACKAYGLSRQGPVLRSEGGLFAANAFKLLGSEFVEKGSESMGLRIEFRGLSPC